MHTGIGDNCKNLNYFKTLIPGTYLVVQWLRLHVPNAGGPVSILGRGTRSHMQKLGKKNPAFHN